MIGARIMETVKNTLKLLLRIYIISYKLPHIIPISMSIILWLGTGIFKIRVGINYIDILNTIGLLTIFYLIVMEKNNFVDYTFRFTRDSKPMPITGKVYRQARRIFYTYFTLLLIEPFLIGIQYILYLFQCESVLLLFLSICYMLTTIVLEVIFMNGYLNLKFMRNEQS